MGNSGKTERREVLYSGQVQGVGFRYTSRQVAGQFEVAGFVENLPDGRVHLVVEGEPAELDAFLAAVDQRLGDFIHQAAIESKPAQGEFAAFEIRLQ